MTANPIIRTILGDIAPAQLGVCYGHDHLLGQPPSAFAKDDLMLDDCEMALKELQAFKAVGGRAVVEMTTPDYGRDAAGMGWLSQQTGVHIIAATGYNHEKFSTPFLQDISIDELVARYVQDVAIGMDDTTFSAGLIKAASPLDEISPLAEKMLVAAAKAHHVTGAPISTHTEAGTMALEQIELLLNAGVAPHNIVIGHLDRKLEWDYHLAIAQTGVFMGFDQISKTKYYPDETRADFICRLIDAGHGQQVLLSSDLARRSYWHSYSKDAVLGYQYILTKFVPLLQKYGLLSIQTDMLLVDNPARAFSFVPCQPA